MTWVDNLFKADDETITDVCPVCSGRLGSQYVRLERIYYCSDCIRVVMYHPYERVPKMLPVKKGSRLNENYTPFQEDRGRGYKPPPDEPTWPFPRT